MANNCSPSKDAISGVADAAMIPPVSLKRPNKMDHQGPYTVHKRVKVEEDVDDIRILEQDWDLVFTSHTAQTLNHDSSNTLQKDDCGSDLAVDHFMISDADQPTKQEKLDDDEDEDNEDEEARLGEDSDENSSKSFDDDAASYCYGYDHDYECMMDAIANDPSFGELYDDLYWSEESWSENDLDPDLNGVADLSFRDPATGNTRSSLIKSSSFAGTGTEPSPRTEELSHNTQGLHHESHRHFRGQSWPNPDSTQGILFASDEKLISAPNARLNECEPFFHIQKMISTAQTLFKGQPERVFELYAAVSHKSDDRRHIQLRDITSDNRSSIAGFVTALNVTEYLHYGHPIPWSSEVPAGQSLCHCLCMIHESPASELGFMLQVVEMKTADPAQLLNALEGESDIGLRQDLKEDRQLGTMYEELNDLYPRRRFFKGQLMNLP